MNISNNFYKTKYFYNFKRETCKAYLKNMKKGHILINGNYSVLFGNHRPVHCAVLHAENLSASPESGPENREESQPRPGLPGAAGSGLLGHRQRKSESAEKDSKIQAFHAEIHLRFHACKPPVARIRELCPDG